jgi:very-short-patch-repair endonuclease
MKNPDKSMGFDLLRRQTIAAVEDRFADTFWAEGDSEIERLFSAALVSRFKIGTSFFNYPLFAPDAEKAERARAKEEVRFSLIVERQAIISQYRVDFLLSAWSDGTVRGGVDGPVVGQPRWRKLVVECDGHDFHERTKEQAAKDRSRDRDLISLGYDVFRFTGSELWRDPWGCATQVQQWAERGMF